MPKIITLILISLIVLLACSGKDKITVDNTPPNRPILVPHLGDYGDGSIEYNNQTIFLNDDNNGIDADPDGDWIRVSWEHFLDTDLDYARIYRFDEFNNIPTLIDSISSNNEYYLDSSSSLSTYIRYSYFIEVVDNNGYMAVSDTVSYMLLSKQILISPATESYAYSDSIKFEWQKSGFVSKFRIMVFDDNHYYMWHSDLDVSFEEDFFEMDLPDNVLQNYLGEYIYWRVDAFDWDYELSMYVGSESNERTLYLQTRK